MKNFLLMVRVHHYMKNLLVPAALICSGHLFDGGKLFESAVGFIVFCLTGSCVYIINDIKDKERDRLHPAKCKRPIASGAVPVGAAAVTAAVCFAAAIIVSLMFLKPVSLLFPCFYLAMNAAYSMGLKNVPILDVVILTAGFFIRVLYGAYIADIVISNWLYLIVLFMAFYFSLGKRRNELKAGTQTRKVLKYYSMEFLDKYMYVCLTLANVFYALWSMEESTVDHYRSSYIVLTVPLVFIITMKYGLDVESGGDGDPVTVLLGDKVLIVLSLLYFIVMFAILYIL
ncbi:MAG: decaprenyl-phosphate phosphoribosyltransferase [Firmicutes bacterium]|nr:decaprenyl-phosphate phosphoribosyltransferase [Bacillota bacterium]